MPSPTPSAPRSPYAVPSSSRWRSEVPRGRLLRDAAQRQASVAIGRAVGAPQHRLAGIVMEAPPRLRRTALAARHFAGKGEIGRRGGGRVLPQRAARPEGGKEPANDW